MRAYAVQSQSISEGFAVCVDVSSRAGDGETLAVTDYLSIEKAEALLASLQEALATARLRLAAKAAAKAVLDGAVTP